MAKSKRPITLAGPGHEGRIEEGERSIVDPYDSGRRYKAKVNVRENAIDHMASRGRVDATQVAAANRFRRMWELAAIGGARGIDFTRVGGHSGKVGDPLTDELVRAGRDLAQIFRVLGLVRSRIVVSIVGEGKHIEEVARSWAGTGGIVSGSRAEGYITGTLIDAIDELIRHWGMEGRPQRKITGTTTWQRNGNDVTVNEYIRAEIIPEQPADSPLRSTEIFVFDDGHAVREEIRPVDKAPLSHQASGNVGSAAQSSKKK